MTRKQKVMVARAIRIATAVVGFTGLIVVFASVASLEQDLIGMKSCIIQSIIGLTMMSGAIKVSNECF